MSVYGVHPTRYGNLNNEQLYSMFRESSYSKLDESEKLDLLQETVNRDALERGEIGAPEVRFADLPVNESGNASNGVINVNRDMAVNGVQSIEYDGQTIQHVVSDYNVAKSKYQYFMRILIVSKIKSLMGRLPLMMPERQQSTRQTALLLALFCRMEGISLVVSI